MSINSILEGLKSVHECIVKLRDKNGVELKTGQRVTISNSYFKSANGTYRIEYSPGDAMWSGNDYSLQRINARTGEDSEGSNSTMSYPLTSYLSDMNKNRLAREHNAKNATIEVVKHPTFDFKDMETTLVKYFTTTLKATNVTVVDSDASNGILSVGGLIDDKDSLKNNLVTKLDKMFSIRYALHTSDSPEIRGISIKRSDKTLANGTVSLTIEISVEYEKVK